MLLKVRTLKGMQILYRHFCLAPYEKESSTYFATTTTIQACHVADLI